MLDYQAHLAATGRRIGAPEVPLCTLPRGTATRAAGTVPTVCARVLRLFQVTGPHPTVNAVDLARGCSRNTS
eukprot:2863205-Rhodomonas_salina.1